MSKEGKTRDRNRKLLSVALSMEEAADMVVRAGHQGTPLADYLGNQVRRGAYGHLYAERVAAKAQPILDQQGTNRAAKGDASESRGDSASST